MKLIDMSVIEFSENLSSEEPTPGGGSASALTGALAASLVSMVCELTIDKEKYADVQEAITNVREEANSIHGQLLRAVDEDALAFSVVMQAYKMPKQTEKEKSERKAAIQRAYEKATKIPLTVAEGGLRVLELSEVAISKGNRNAVSDAGVAAGLARACVEGAVLNVRINIPSLKNEDLKKTMKTDSDQILETTEMRYKICIEEVDKALSA